MYLHNGRGTAANRAGFTIIEMFIVMAIIAVLATLVAGTVTKILMAGMGSTTRDRLSAIQKDLDSKWAKVTDDVRHEAIPSAVMNELMNGIQVSPNQLAVLAGTDVQATQRAHVLWVKYRQMQAFPQSFTEIFNPDPLNLGVPPLFDYRQVLSKAKITKALNNPPQLIEELESSACLLMALQHFGASIDTYGPAVATFPYGNGALEVRAFKDAWDNQIVFCRWPDNSSRLNPGGAQPGQANDSADPTGLLLDQSWLSNTLAKNLFVKTFHHVGNNTGGKHSFNLRPVVVSRGPDQLLGLSFVRRSLSAANENLFFSTIVAGDEQDNIYSTLP